MRPTGVPGPTSSSCGTIRPKTPFTTRCAEMLGPMQITRTSTIETWHRLNHLRVGVIALLCPTAALVLFAVAGVLTDGDPPRTAVEWFVSILGTVLVLPAVGVARVLGPDTHEVLFWLSWWLSGLFWAILIEAFVIAKNARRP